MTDVGDSGSKEGSREGWQKRKSRDDTPSFIRDVQARAEMLHPNRNTEEHIPVLAMPRSVRIWRRVRWPLFVGIVVVALGALALFTHDRLQVRSIEKRIAEAHQQEQSGTIQGLLEAGQGLSVLAERHPDRVNAQAAWAWHAVLLAELFGPADHYLERARAAIGQATGDDSGPAMAARAGVKALSGDAAGALEAVLDGLKTNAREPRLLLARCMALRSSGDLAGAAAALADLSASHPEYLPARHLALVVALETRDRDATRALAKVLLGRSPGHLVASLGLVAADLPDWGEADPPTETTNRMREEMATLSRGIAEAPPRIAAMGRLIEGRVALLSGQVDDAVTALNSAFSGNPSPANLGWLALAVRGKQGIDAALALLDGHPDVAGPEVHDVRARCLLDAFRVGAAREALAVLERTGALPEARSEMAFVLAVRAGETDEALRSLPRPLAEHLWQPALELYEQLRSRGDTDGIDALLAAMPGELAPCAKAIRAWHGNRTGNALAALDREGDRPPCLDALAARFLLGHAEPAGIAEAALRASRAGGDNPILELLRVRAIWLSEGHAAAVKLLGALRQRQFDAPPLKLAVAETCLDLGLAEDALAELEGIDADPVARALRLRALGMLGRKDELATAVGEVTAGGEDPAHPALLLFILEREFEAGALDRVAEKAKAARASAGRWTAEIAEMEARALNVVGARGDADRALEAAAREARQAAGQGEGWETRMAQIRLNLRRGGAFLYKAQSVITELTQVGLKDAELSYSLGVANIRQGNDRGAVRYLRDAIRLDPSFTPAYGQLEALGKLDDEDRAGLERTRPGAVP